MEWDYKDFAWDSNDLAALVGSSTTSTALVDLKLGSSEVVVPPIASKTKRVGHHQKVKVSSCLVDGCRAELSRCREYHRRHRVCELHSKTPLVVIRGQHKRFCQQCSRFHSVLEFDEVKRSCRKRLNGHNQRRRKPKPGSFYFPAKNFISSYKGPSILHFGTPQISATTNVRSLWPFEAKSSADHQQMLYDCQQRLQTVDQLRSPPNSFHNNGGADKQLIFLQTNDPKVLALNQAATPQAFARETFPTSTAASALPQSTGVAANSAIYIDGTTRGIDPGCALHLLSSSNPTHSLVNNSLSHMDHPNNVVTSTDSGHQQQLQMKSSFEFSSYCLNI